VGTSANETKSNWKIPLSGKFQPLDISNFAPLTLSFLKQLLFPYWLLSQSSLATIFA
jgi:hypothetical protein